VLIEGRLKLDTWEATDGQKRSKLKVTCERMQMLGSRPAGPATGPAEGGARAPAARRAPEYDQASQAAQAGPPPESFEPPPESPPDDIPF
jgi:single-strand DNA-binding protein